MVRGVVHIVHGQQRYFAELIQTKVQRTKKIREFWTVFRNYRVSIGPITSPAKPSESMVLTYSFYEFRERTKDVRV